MPLQYAGSTGFHHSTSGIIWARISVQNIPQSQCQNRTFSKFHKLLTLRLSWRQAGRQLFLENIQLLPFRRKLQCLEVQLATCIINPYWKSTKTIWAVVCLLEFIAGNKNVKTKLKTLKVECNLSTRVTLPHFSQWQWGATGDPWLKILLCWIYESSIFKIIWWSGQNWPYYTG